MTSSSRAAADRTAVGRTALTNVRVFDGRELSQPRTVVIDGGVIRTDDSGAQVLDVAGAVLLPGLIDAHIHLHGRDTLEQLCSYGVTTGLDMGSGRPNCWLRFVACPD
jgi:imidazolonepropionase-like amidohydrolase